MPDLSAIVVSYNTRDLLADCLRALLAAAEGAALNLEAIVVDNGSTDGSVAMLAEAFPSAIVLRNATNLGFAAANNRGLARATAPLALLLNSDAFVTAATLRGAVAVLRAEPRAGLVGVRVLNPDGTLQAADGVFPSLWADLCVSLGTDQLVRPRRGAPARVGPAEWVHGACMIVRRAALEWVGPLDERFFMYSEEVDWCRRFRAAGWTVWYCGAATVVHFGGASHGSDLRRRAALYRGRLGLRRRLGGPLASAALWGGVVAGLVARAGVRALAQGLLRRPLGRQSPRGDWEIAREIARLDPLSRWAVA